MIVCANSLCRFMFPDKGIRSSTSLQEGKNKKKIHFPSYNCATTLFPSNKKILFLHHYYLFSFFFFFATGFFILSNRYIALFSFFGLFWSRIRNQKHITLSVGKIYWKWYIQMKYYQIIVGRQVFLKNICLCVMRNYFIVSDSIL
jgi:hypothetical protein